MVSRKVSIIEFYGVHHSVEERKAEKMGEKARKVLENLFFDLEESRRVGFECEIDAFEEDLNLPWLKGLISEMKDQSVTDWLIFAQRCAKTGVMV